MPPILLAQENGVTKAKTEEPALQLSPCQARTITPGRRLGLTYGTQPGCHRGEPMQLDDLMAELEQLGTAQNRKIYARHGANDPMFGVSFANLDNPKKRVKVDSPPLCDLCS